MAGHNDFGSEAEELAADYLAKLGYQILVRNYRYLKAEVDIICKMDNTVVFVEVKARSTDLFLEPHEAVSKKKIRLVVSAADQFMESRVEDARFDIISVLPDQSGALQISHLTDAFSAIDAQ